MHEALKVATKDRIMYEICNSSKNVSVITQLFQRLTKTDRPKKVRAYLRSKGIRTYDEDIGFIPKNYPGRPNRKLIATCGKYGLLSPLLANGYGLWPNDSIVFPLRNREGEICGLYGQSISGKRQHKPQYLSNREGLYPAYPSPHIPILVLAKNMMDAALLCRHPHVVSTYNILALCSNDGLTPEHCKAIRYWAVQCTEQSRKTGAPLPHLGVMLLFDPEHISNPVLRKIPEKIQQLLPWVDIVLLKP